MDILRGKCAFITSIVNLKVNRVMFCCKLSPLHVKLTKMITCFDKLKFLGQHFGDA